MALGETARLVATLELQDKFSHTAQAATTQLNKLEGSTIVAGRGFAGVSRLAAGAGGALTTFKSRLGGIISGPLGLLGLGAGLYSVGNLLGSSIGQAKDFGAEVLRLNALTGEATKQTSELAAAFEHFGISTEDSQRVVGFAEKNLFKYGGTAKAAKTFQDKYGLALRDSTGHLKDFNTILLDSADFFNNKAIPAQQKAAGLAVIYGKSWQTLIPILSAGRQTIADVEQEAAKLGLTLTDKNLADLVQLRDATRQWDTSLAGLKLQIGLVLVPELLKLTNAASGFLASGGREQIVGFFQNLVTFGDQAGQVIQNDVIPVFKGIYGAWQSVPSELRDLIIKGFAADRTIKFLFGFSPASLVIGGLKELIGSKFIPQLVTVTNPGFGLPGGGGGLPVVPAAEAAGGLGALGLFGSAVLVAGLGAAAAAIAIPVVRQLTFNGTDPTIPGGSRGFFPGKGPADLQKYLDANSTAVKDNTDAILKGTTKGQLPGAPGGGNPQVGRPKLSDKELIALLAKTSEFGFAGIGTKIEHGPLTGTDPFGKQALALFRQAEFPRQGKTLGEIERHIIAAEDAQKQYLAKGDTKSARLIQVTIDGLRALLRGTDKVATITQAEAQKRADTANRLNRLLDPLPGGIAKLNAKDFNPIVNVRVTTNTQVSVSNVVRAVNNYTAAIGSGPGGAVANPY